MTGRNDAGCNFLIGSTLHQSKPFLKLDKWMHVALVKRNLQAFTELYVDGIYFEDLLATTNMITYPSYEWYS